MDHKQQTFFKPFNHNAAPLIISIEIISSLTSLLTFWFQLTTHRYIKLGTVSLNISVLTERTLLQVIHHIHFVCLTLVLDYASTMKH